MTNQEAQFLAGVMIRTLEQEFSTTKKVIAALESAKLDYRPDPKSKTAFELAHHIATSDVWFLKSIAAGEFDFNKDQGSACEAKTVSELLKWFEPSYTAALESVRGISADKLAESISFMGMPELPLVSYLVWQLNHSVHHRGQLSAYLRAAGAKVPSIYGGSADEPMAM